MSGYRHYGPPYPPNLKQPPPMELNEQAQGLLALPSNQPQDTNPSTIGYRNSHSAFNNNMNSANHQHTLMQNSNPHYAYDGTTSNTERLDMLSYRHENPRYANPHQTNNPNQFLNPNYDSPPHHGEYQNYYSPAGTAPTPPNYSVIRMHRVWNNQADPNQHIYSPTQPTGGMQTQHGNAHHLQGNLSHTHSHGAVGNFMHSANQQHTLMYNSDPFYANDGRIINTEGFGVVLGNDGSESYSSFDLASEYNDELSFHSNHENGSQNYQYNTQPSDRSDNDRNNQANNTATGTVVTNGTAIATYLGEDVDVTRQQDFNSLRAFVVNHIQNPEAAEFMNSVIDLYRRIPELPHGSGRTRNGALKLKVKFLTSIPGTIRVHYERRDTVADLKNKVSAYLRIRLDPFDILINGRRAADYEYVWTYLRNVSGQAVPEFRAAALPFQDIDIVLRLTASGQIVAGVSSECGNSGSPTTIVLDGVYRNFMENLMKIMQQQPGEVIDDDMSTVSGGSALHAISESQKKDSSKTIDNGNGGEQSKEVDKRLEITLDNFHHNRCVPIMNGELDSTTNEKNTKIPLDEVGNKEMSIVTLHLDNNEIDGNGDDQPMNQYGNFTNESKDTSNHRPGSNTCGMIFPSIDAIHRITPLAIVGGKGVHHRLSPFHQLYLDKKDSLRDHYVSAMLTSEKRLIQKELIQWVTDQGGKFFKRNNNGTFQEMTEREKLRTAAAALHTERRNRPLSHNMSKYVPS